MKEPVGRVYVLTNPRVVGLVKIGFTLGTVEGKAKELPKLLSQILGPLHTKLKT